MFLPLPQPPQVFTARGFEALFPLRWNPGLCGLSHSPVVPPGLSALKCGTAQSASCRLAHPHPPVPCLESSPLGCPSPSLLPIGMNVSSLTPWLLDFHTVQFSGISGCFLFLNLLLSFFGCARRHTYASILAGSLKQFPFKNVIQMLCSTLLLTSPQAKLSHVTK